MNHKIFILSIDGGGIRGIIPAVVLSHIEKRTGRPICDLFDLIAGTSTGGILALGLTRPVPGRGRPMFSAADMLRLYFQEGHRIFHRSAKWWLRSCGGLVQEKYPSEGIEGVLEQYFHESLLTDSLTHLLIPAYDIELRRSRFFDNRDRVLMREVARATSAAPTYFEPAQVDLGYDYAACIDGGVFANNPALCAYVEAQKLWPGAEVHLLSLGTGCLQRRIPLQQAVSYGAAQWTRHILSILMDGPSQAADHQCHVLLGDRYLRLQASLQSKQEDMDNVSEDSMRELKCVAENLVAAEESEIEQFISKLKGTNMPDDPTKKDDPPVPPPDEPVDS